jgi:hypothetical protein
MSAGEPFADTISYIGESFGLRAGGARISLKAGPESGIHRV